MSKVTVRLYEKRGYADGGLVQAAEAVRGHGRWGDEILIHVNPEEFEQMKKMWGDPTHNPHTGLPEYGWLSKMWKKIKPIFKAIAPIALNFIPGVGTALSAGLSAIGVGAKALPLATAIAKGAIGGSINGGSKGALVGGLTGGLGGGAGIASKLGMQPGALSSAFGDALVGGATARAGGGDFGQGALIGGLGSLAMPYANNALAGTGVGRGLGLSQVPTYGSPGNGIGETADGLSQYTPVNGRTPGLDVNTLANGMEEVTVSGSRIGSPTNANSLTANLASAVPWNTKSDVSTGANSIATPDVGAEDPGPEPEEGSFMDKAFGYMKNNKLQTATMLAGLASLGGPPDAEGAPAVEQDPSMLTPLQQFSFNRQRSDPNEDYYTYGMRPEKGFYTNNGPPTRMARGGIAGLPTRGEPTDMGGRADTIEAQLSEGEYVIDAETVALLGDGSTKAGAAKLEKLRQNVRKHKGRALAKGKISPDAKGALAYLKGVK